jgi:hypothetical protein
VVGAVAEGQIIQELERVEEADDTVYIRLGVWSFSPFAVFVA